MTEVSAANRQLLKKLVVVAIAMFAFGFLLVPIYQKICEVTGINNVLKPDAPRSAQLDESRLVTIEFDANLRSELPWRFVPERTKMQVHPGQLVQVMYDIENNSDRTIMGQAIPSYGPARAGKYFSKLACFCFAQQHFRPGEKRKMPVVFVIDPSLPEDIDRITLSYSFFEVPATARAGGS
jgi:cytochrome c oxidase assembly protein subunit 11